MASISKQKLKELVMQAYDSGYHGSLELKEEYAEETLEDFLRDPDEEEWKVYSIKELLEMPIGSVFTHNRLGKCKIHGNSLKDKHMVFENGEVKHFASDSDPWDEPMKIEK
jgi:hypothetical protein